MAHIRQLKAQGPSRTCNESKEEEDIRESRLDSGLGFQVKVLETCQVVPSSLGSGSLTMMTDPDTGVPRS